MISKHAIMKMWYDTTLYLDCKCLECVQKLKDGQFNLPQWAKKSQNTSLRSVSYVSWQRGTARSFLVAARRAATRLLLTAGRAAIDRYLLSARPTGHCSKYAAATCGGRMMGRTERRTDGRTPDSFIDPPAHIMPTVPIRRKPFFKKKAEIAQKKRW